MLSAFDELKEILNKEGYTEQQIIDLLSRFLEENSPNQLDKTVFDYEDDNISFDNFHYLYELINDDSKK